jgi:beta-lactam-binding protein with PASTA domain
MDMPVIRAGDPRAAEMPGVAPLLTTEAVQITLNYPELPGNVRKLVVEAGGHVGLPAVVRNQSGIVDNYELQVRGMPAEWWNVTPPSVYLVPFGAPSGTYEEQVQINFHPPRSAEAEARLWDVEVVAVSRAQNEVAGTTDGKVEITPYEQLESELRPLVVTGRRRGEFALMVRNRANAPLDTEITAVDTANALTFQFAKQRFIAEPGRRDGTTFKAKAKRTLWIGRPTDRRFDIVAKGVTSETATTRPITGTFRQKPVIPFWVPIVIPALIAGAILAYSLIPKKTTVPVLRGRTAAAALVLLQKAHLKAATNPPQEVPNRHIARGRVVSQTPSAGSHVKNNTVVTFTIAEPLVPNLLGKNQSQAKLTLGGRGLVLSTSPPDTKISKKPPGTIIGQVPGAGRPARTGSQVSIIVAIGTGLKKVPNVVGLTLPAADAALRSAGLSIVLPTVPPNQDPTKVTIASQIPTADETVKSGQPVQVFLVPPPKPPPTKHTGPKKLAVVGASASAAAAAVAAAGGTPVIVKQFDVAKPGTVISAPTQVSPGQQAQIVVSAGYPQIAYSDGRSILLMNGATGAGSAAIAKSGDAEDEPAWQPNGTLVAYRRGPTGNPNQGQIWMTDLSKGATSARPMTAGPDDRRPAFSPNGKVIAFIRRTPTSTGGTDGDLCFVSIASTLHQGVCIKDPNFSVDRPTWSPDGRAILVVAVDPANPNQTELGEYTTANPNSPNTQDWVWQGLVTDKMHGTKPGEGILFAAFAPDGKTVALVANWGVQNTSLFKIFTATWAGGQLGTPTPVAPAIRACEVAWRSDSQELVVTQADNCNSGQGAIVRVKLSDPGTVTTLRAAGGQNPTWQPITLQ